MAIKTVTSMDDNADVIESLRKEVDVLKKLRHDNIVQLYGFFDFVFFFCFFFYYFVILFLFYFILFYFIFPFKFK